MDSDSRRKKERCDCPLIKHLLQAFDQPPRSAAVLKLLLEIYYKWAIYM